MRPRGFERTVRGRPTAPGRWITMAVLALLGTAGATQPARAQDSNILLPPAQIEKELRTESVKILQETGSRWKKDRTQRVTIKLADSTLMMVKFAAARPGADTFNNRPRYEVAAYQIQKLFLDPKDYVVPPTVVRCFNLDWYRKYMDSHAEQTFQGPHCVITELQYWIWNAHIAKPYDEARWKSDTLYARHMANFNVVMALIKQQDSNLGNYLVSDDSSNMRVFSVDNGLAFETEPGNRGHKWESYRLDGIPKETLARLRKITEPDLEKQLSVLAQFQVAGDTLEPVPPGPCLNTGWGVRFQNGIVQLGLTDREIHNTYSRLQDLLKQVDDGKVHAF